MIRLTATGLEIVDGRGWEAGKRAFADRHFVVLKGFLAGALRERAWRLIDMSRFRPRADRLDTGEVWCRELTAERYGPVRAMFLMLLNSQRVFAVVDELAAEPVGTYHGRLLKSLPDTDHYDSWHEDVGAGRQLGLSINMARTPYVGGELEIRDHRRRIQHRVANGPGDAILFRIARGVEHHVLPVRGTVTKCTFAGWFSSGDYRRTVLPELMANRGPTTGGGLATTGPKAPQPAAAAACPVATTSAMPSHSSH